MLLAINIGNTNINMGLFANKKLVSCVQIQTQKKPTANYYKAVLKNLSPFKNIEAIAICSVVASLTNPFQKLLKKHLKLKSIIVKEDLNLGIRLNYKKKQLGADRIANTVGAYCLYKKGCIIIDTGTAITFDIVSPKGVYLGGAIAPGIGISSKALFSNTSLPNIQNLNNTKFTIGKNTNENLQIGILHGFAYMIEGMLNKFKKKLNFKPLIILTGGDAKKISKMVKFSHIVNPYLTLEGIRIIYEENVRK
ncbi:type III pantothenate kinase [bacterium]|nr:type III pantothenate kinase [bacterium]